MASDDTFAEIEADDLAAVWLKTVGPTPVQLSVWGSWKPCLPLPYPPPANRREMMTPRWGKYLPAPKTYCDVETWFERNVSLTKRWIKCNPDIEEQLLRRKNAERIKIWRDLLITNKNGIFLPCLFKYKNTKSLLDIICPTKKTRLDNSFEVVDLKDIIPEIVVDFCEDMVPLEDDQPVKPQAPIKKTKKTQKKKKFFSCFVNILINKLYINSETDIS